MLLKLISLSLAVQIIKATGTYSSKGCYALSDLASYLTSKGEYTYQTNSYCEQQCSSYAVAATLDGSTCYCGNDLPSSISSVSSSKCSVTCQGYSTEICGGDGYLSVYTNGDENTGSSSSSDSDSSTTSEEASTTTLSSTTSQAETTSSTTTSETTTEEATTTSDAATGTTSDDATTTSETTTTDTTPAATTTGASTSIQIITSVISGSEAVITATQTVSASSSSSTSSSGSKSNNSNTSSSASSSSASSSSPASSSDGLSKGAIAGIAIGSVIGVFGIIGLIIGCFCYLRHQNDDDDDDNALDESGSSINNKYNSEKPIHNDLQFYGSQMNSNTNNMNGFQNPNAPFFSFDEVNGHKRLSNGSLPDARHEKTLRVVNPDDEEHNDPTLKHDDDGHMTDESDDSDWRK